MENDRLRFPHHAGLDYESSIVEERRQWLAARLGANLATLAGTSFDARDARGNVENFIGTAQVPIGVVGPLVINGQDAVGTFFVPFATTEGGMVATHQRGAMALARSGGITTRLLSDENLLAPIFVLDRVEEASNFIHWVEQTFSKIRAEAESTTRHGRLIRITPHVIGRRAILVFAYQTMDAMGANMINIATEAACRWIARNFPIETYFLRSNFTSEKKASGSQLVLTYGKQVVADAVIPRKVVRRYLNSTPEKVADAWHSWALASFACGMLGINAQYANGLAAIYIACGQDVAHVANGCLGVTAFERTSSGDLYACVKLPSLLVGTVGGGTALGTQRACLEMLGCYGPGKAGKLAEIVAASLLAGEVGICGGITSEQFLEPHKRARVHTVAKTKTLPSNG